MERSKLCFLSVTLLVSSAISLGLPGKLQADEETKPKLCSSDFFKDSCTDDSKKPLDLRKDKTEADGVLFNYFLVNQRESVADIRRLNSKPTHDQQTNTVKTAEEVRKIAIANVIAGRDEKNLPGDALAVIERLRTVKIRVVSENDSTCFERGDAGIPNAGYSPLEHAVNICPAMAKVPTQEIAETIAHELGHVVSPCSMSKELLRFDGGDIAVGACLLGIGEGDDRSESDREIWGDGPIPISNIPDQGYALNMEPEKNQALVRCGAANVVHGSQLKNPEFYQSFNRCAEALYKTAREDAFAFELFRVEKKPNFSKIAQPKRKEWETQYNERLAKEAPACFRKREEHFADSLGGQLYAAWAKSKDLSAKQYAVGLHALSHAHCSEKVSKNFQMSPHQYPSSAERLEILMKPRYVSDLLGCEPPKSEALCQLPEDAFARSGSGSKAAPSSGSPTQSGGTTR